MNSFPFSKNLFWDCLLDDIDLKKNKGYVIERVMTRGQLNDFNILLGLYTREEIVQGLTKVRGLDPKTAHFCSWYFNIPSSELHVSFFYR